MQPSDQNMIIPIVQQMMFNNPDIEGWRRQLIKQQFFSAQEARDLNEREITLLHRTLLISQMQRMSSNALLNICRTQHIRYIVDIDDDLQAGAVGY